MQTKYYSSALLLTSLFFFDACSTREAYKNPSIQKTTFKSSGKLTKELKRWQGTRYKYGGLSLRGVDCSGFVYSVYKNVYGIKLPRTTRGQSKAGYEISRSKAQVGDLVFFKTGYNSHHSGIIVEKGKFMHSSSSKGVIISSLDNPYWKSKYWHMRRVL